MQRQSDGGLAMASASLTQNPVPDPLQGGGTWSFSQNGLGDLPATLPAGGWTQLAQQQIQLNITAMNAVTGSTRQMQMAFYECGNGWGGGGSQQSFLTTFSLSSAMTSWFENSLLPMYASQTGGYPVNIWNWCSGTGSSGNFGLIQSAMQAQSGVNVPALWAGAAAYAP